MVEVDAKFHGYRAHAEEVREIALSLQDVNLREVLLDIATDYLRIAEATDGIAQDSLDLVTSEHPESATTQDRRALRKRESGYWGSREDTGGH